MVSLFSILRLITMVFDIESHIGGGTRKRRTDNFDGNDSELDILAVRHGQKRRKCSDLDFRSNDFLVLGTNSYNSRSILNWLSEDDITTIGIYGMGGIGKTTLTNHVVEQVLKHGIPAINAVVWVSVGLHVTLSQIQREIADQLKLDLQDEKDEIRRAATLNSVMSSAGNLVIILDDLWDDFRLELVGIPKHCKLIITSRSLDVCRRMRCRKIQKIEPLPQEEAWQLFSHTVGHATLEKELRQIAELVCGTCAGVPLAITTLAKNMKGIVDASLWRQALVGFDRFYSGSPKTEDIFHKLKLSYANLNETLQSCFLYCALFPKGYTIDREELIHLWIGEMLIDDVLPLQPQYDKGHSIINKLLNASLLEASEDKRWVKMNDLIRDMAIAIIRGSFMVKAGMSLTKLPAEYEWREDLHVASFMVNSISDISIDASPKCPNLSSFLLQHNPIQAIPDSFFLHMRALHFLNLSYTSIKILPSSMSELEELRMLDVNSCRFLEQVPSLEKLQKLQFLDLSNTAIGQLPSCIERLKVLRELNLSCIPTLKIPSGMLSGFCRLKRLTYSVSGTITDLLSLRSLEILDATFPSLSDLNSYVRSQHWRTLECFHLQVGHNKGSKKVCSRGVSLHDCSFNGKGGNCVMLPDNIQELYITDCKDFSSLSDIISSADACDCRKFHSCSYPNCVPKTNRKGEEGFEQQAGVFSSLEVCTISRCHDVESLFAPAWTQKFPCLEEIDIEDCPQLKELIAEKGGKDCHSHGTSSVIRLPQLKQLVLTRLPQLSSIYKGVIVCSSLYSTKFLDCPKLNRLPFSFYVDDQHRLPTLERIEGQEEWWELLEWDQPESKYLLKSLFRGVKTM